MKDFNKFFIYSNKPKIGSMRDQGFIIILCKNCGTSKGVVVAVLVRLPGNYKAILRKALGKKMSNPSTSERCSVRA
jgi:hypothetical protein